MCFIPQVHEYRTAYKDSSNVLFLHFEKMKADPRASALEVAKFLGKDVTEDELTTLLDHTSFKKMKVSEENISIKYQQGNGIVVLTKISITGSIENCQNDLEKSCDTSRVETVTFK